VQKARVIAIFHGPFLRLAHPGRFRAWLSTLLAAVAFLQVPLSGAVLEDFGYSHRNPNGPRYLVVIVVEFTGKPPLAHPPEYYDSLVFDFPSTHSLNSYFLENSNGRFYWKRAGAGLIVLRDVPVPPDSPTDHPAGIAAVIYRAIQSGFDFAQFDTDSDGVVSPAELGIVLISNFGPTNGATRFANPLGLNQYYDFPLPNTSTTLRPYVSAAEHQASFNMLAHETCHQLTPHDLYGDSHGECLSIWLTLMSCETTLPDDPTVCHLDPWHKMQFGWCEPRIRSLRAGGVEVLPSAQSLDPNRPVILYDPAVSYSEFFMLEYRATDSPSGPGYDADAAGTGLVIWHIQQDANHDPVGAPASDPRLGVWAEGAPSLGRGVNFVWTSGAITPYLKRNDGTETKTRFFVRPFNLGDGTITVEWWAEEEMWVDFTYTGFFEFGLFDFPFNTLAEGVGAVPYGGFLKIKAGFTPETATIAKRMTIDAFGGPVTLGQ